MHENNMPLSKDAEEFHEFCRQATDAQLRNIFHKENDAGREGYAMIARWVAEYRGIDL